MKNLTLFLALTSLASAASSQADVIFNDFGPGDTYDTNAWNVQSTQSIATAFNVTQAATLTTVELGLFSSAGNYTVSLARGGATTPGATLYSWTVTLPTTGSSESIADLAPTGVVNLAVGSYYVVATNPSSFGGWIRNTTGVTGGFSYAGSGAWAASTNITPVMRITVNPTPEPSALAALGLGAVAMLRRRKRA